MPIYEYLCSECSATTEKVQTRPLEQITCPVCGKKARKVVSLFASSGTNSGDRCTPVSGSGFG